MEVSFDPPGLLFGHPLVCFHDRAKASFLDQMITSEQMSVLFSFKNVHKDAYL